MVGGMKVNTAVKCHDSLLILINPRPVYPLALRRLARGLSE
jgi:hypothetical protein